MTKAEPGTEPAAERLALRTQLVRFVISGGLSAVVDFGLLVVLMNLAGLDHTPAKALSFIAGTTTAYLINRRWTFQAEPSKRRFAAVVVLYGLTFAVQVGLFAWLFPLVLSWTAYLFPRAKDLLEGTPRVIVRDGEIVTENLQRDRLTRDELQGVIKLLRERQDEFAVPLQFTNYR